MIVFIYARCPYTLTLFTYFKRHFHIRDPVLTVRGREQAVDLNATLFDNVQQDVQLVVSSPMRRAMQTAIIALGEANRRLGKENMILLPHAQECNACKSAGNCCSLDSVARITDLRR